MIDCHYMAEGNRERLTAATTAAALVIITALLAVACTQWVSEMWTERERCVSQSVHILVFAWCGILINGGAF